MTILAIETSCDETAAAVVSANLAPAIPEVTMLSSVIRSQIQLHTHMGGVVPEVAARAHVAAIEPVVKKALANAKVRFGNIDYLAVTQGPGLMPSLLVGVEFTKALGFSLGKPVLPVNHMLGHLLSPLKDQASSDECLAARKNGTPSTLFPMVSLIVSGGHTMLVLMDRPNRYRVLGQTVDDAAGEAFDKVAKLLGLPYPGGPEVSKLAERSKNPPDFPRPMINSPDFNFSFAGLKTAVRYYVESLLPPASLGAKHSTLSAALKADICAGFQNAAVDVLVSKTLKAAAQYKAKSVSISGGVSANRVLRKKTAEACEKAKIALFIPPFSLCTDNAEMIAFAAAYLLKNKPKIPRTFEANPSLKL